MKLLRIIVLILTLLLLVAAIAITSLVIFVDPNRLKPVIIKEVAKETGYQLVIDSKLSWSFYPIFGVRADEMHLHSPDAALDVSFQDVNFTAPISQLLQKTHPVEGKVFVGEVKIRNVLLTNVHTDFVYDNQMLKLNNVDGELYHGTIRGNITIAQITSDPTWKWKITLEDVEIKPFLIDANIQSKLMLSGVAQLKLETETTGKTASEQFENLNGTADFMIKRGSIEGINLGAYVEEANAFVAQHSIKTEKIEGQTDFDSFTGSANIKKGIIETNNVILLAPAFVTKCLGNLDLVNQTMDLRLQVVPVNPTKLKGAVPILITGKLSEPSIRLDMLMLKTMVMHDQLNKAEPRVAGDLKQLPEKADKLLKKILGK